MMITPWRTTLSTLCALAVLAGTARAENWPQWRGPRGDSTSAEKNLPTKWSTTENVAWSAATPGQGYSTPVIWGDKLFITSAWSDGHDRGVICYDAKTGKQLWQTVAVTSKQLEPHHQENNYATSGPATDGKAVYTSFAADERVNFSAIDYDGKVLWSVSPLKYAAEHGYSYTPTLDDGRLYFAVHQWAEPAVIAIDAATGKTLWQHELDNKSCANVPPSIINVGGAKQLVAYGNLKTQGFDPASGKMIWEVDGPTAYCVAGIAYGGGVLIVSGGYPEKKTLGIRPDPVLPAGTPRIAWEQKKMTTYVPTPIFKDGYFYCVIDGGTAWCMDAKDGEFKWQQRIGGHIRPSMILSEDNLYCTDDEGKTTIFKASPDGYKEVAVNTLAEFVYASPAPSNGRIFMRTGTKLYCIGAK